MKIPVNLPEEIKQIIEEATSKAVKGRREFIVTVDIPLVDVGFENFTKEDWVMSWIERYGGIDGAHHKDWVLDQIARILMDTEVLCKITFFTEGQPEIRPYLGEPSLKYLNWVKLMKQGEDGPDTYDYDEGVAP